MSDYSDPSPFNPVPPVITCLALAIFGAELAFVLGEGRYIGGAGAIGWRSQAIEQFGFFTPMLHWMVETKTLRPDFAMRMVTYPFVGHGMIETLFASAMVLAIGKFVAERMHQIAVLVLFFASCAFGALVYAIIFPSNALLIGAFPGVYGLIGGLTCLMWLYLGQLGENQMRAFTLIGFLLAIQLVFGLLFGTGNDWVAEIAGFLAGFTLSFVLVPGGFQRLRDRLQQRG